MTGNKNIKCNYILIIHFTVISNKYQKVKSILKDRYVEFNVNLESVLAISSLSTLLGLLPVFS
jgi:hypothetical protein